ncbi:MAG: hypothetical protein PWQ15_1372 [Methanobacterium sp.]|nr:hypothetical protein [Methanobacterium sp.]
MLKSDYFRIEIPKSSLGIRKVVWLKSDYFRIEMSDADIDKIIDWLLKSDYFRIEITHHTPRTTHHTR